jgi:periplasmic divalent cation tolerance protein
MTYVQVQFAIDEPGTADAIVEALLAEQLVACAQRLGPMVSRYWWRGSVEQADEWLVLLKTRSELASRVIHAVVKLHPYETPEVVALPVLDGHAGYLDWIRDVTAAPPR